MDRYWSYVATPLFFSVIGFGVFTLFSAQEAQFDSTKGASNTASLITTGVAASKSGIGAASTNSYTKVTNAKPGRAHTPPAAANNAKAGNQ